MKSLFSRKPRYRGVLFMAAQGAWHLRLVLQQGDSAPQVQAEEFFDSETLVAELRKSGLVRCEVSFDNGEVVIRTLHQMGMGAEGLKIKRALQAYYPDHDGIACEWSYMM